MPVKYVSCRYNNVCTSVFVINIFSYFLNLHLDNNYITIINNNGYSLY